MSWDFRVIRSLDHVPNVGYIQRFRLIEAFYDAHDEIEAWCLVDDLIFDSLDQMRDDLMAMLEATTFDVIEVADLPRHDQ